MHVYLIRHAQSEGNVLDYKARLHVDDFNSELERSPAYALTERGIQQAEALATQLAEANVVRLYSSPFQRALITARIYGQAIGLEPIIIPELQEVVPQLVHKNRPNVSLRQHYLRSFARMAWTSKGPSWSSERTRARLAWQLITAEPVASDQAIVAVSHGWLITLILFGLRKNPQWRIIRRDVHNAGISLVVSVA